MKFPINWLNESATSNAFTYATRTKIGPAFGARPIGWYQLHQCAALDELERCARAVTGAHDKAVPVTVRLKSGVFYAKSVNGPEYRCITPREVWDVADKKARA